MAYDNNQEDFPLPKGNQNTSDRKTSNLLPKYFRTPTNTKFLHSTLDQLLNPGTVINHNLEKSDIYSYGIMVKLMYPSLFDEEFLNELTHRYPFRRPSAQDILNKLNEDFLGGKKRTKRRRKQRRSKRRRETPFAKEY